MEITFYLLQTNHPQDRDDFLIKLLNRTQKDKHLVDISLANLEEASRLSQNLWLKPAHGYLAHSINHKESAPIQLQAPKINQPTNDILINLTNQPYSLTDQNPDQRTTTPPTNLTHNYQRLIEVYDQSQTLLEAGRENWKAYKNQGFEITVHKI